MNNNVIHINFNSVASIFFKNFIHGSLQYLRRILKSHYHAIPLIDPFIKFKCRFHLVFFFYLDAINPSLRSITEKCFDPYVYPIMSPIFANSYSPFSTKSFKAIKLLTSLIVRFGFLNALFGFRHSDVDLRMIPRLSNNFMYILVLQLVIVVLPALF